MEPFDFRSLRDLLSMNTLQFLRSDDCEQYCDLWMDLEGRAIFVVLPVIDCLQRSFRKG